MDNQCVPGLARRKRSGGADTAGCTRLTSSAARNGAGPSSCTRRTIIASALRALRLRTKSVAPAGFVFPLQQQASDRRSAQCEAAAELAQQEQIRPGHAAVQDVAQNGDVQILDRPQPVPDGQSVQQRLGRMFVGAVAC